MFRKVVVVCFALLGVACGKAESPSLATEALKRTAELKRQEAINSLPETSAIKKVLREEEKQKAEQQRNVGIRNAYAEKISAAQQVGDELKLGYVLVSNSINTNLNSASFLEIEGAKKFGSEAALAQIYPECLGSYGIIKLDCLYASFILRRIVPNKELYAALALSRDAGVKIVLTYYPIPLVSGSDIMSDNQHRQNIYISVTAPSDEKIVQFLTKDAG